MVKRTKQQMTFKKKNLLKDGEIHVMGQWMDGQMDSWLDRETETCKDTDRLYRMPDSLLSRKMQWCQTCFTIAIKKIHTFTWILKKTFIARILSEQYILPKQIATL